MNYIRIPIEKKRVLVNGAYIIHFVSNKISRQKHDMVN